MRKLILITIALVNFTLPVFGQEEELPIVVTASDHNWDGGDKIDLEWKIPLDILDIIKGVELIRQIKDGADFATIAEIHSTEPNSAEKGGDLGWFGRGSKEPLFEEAAFNANVGDIVGPVESQLGYHIIWVRDKRGEDDEEEVQASHILLKKVETFKIYRSNSTDEIDAIIKDEKSKAVKDAKEAVTKRLIENAEKEGVSKDDKGLLQRIRDERKSVADNASQDITDREGDIRAESEFKFLTVAGKNETTFTVEKLEGDIAYSFKILALDKDGNILLSGITDKSISPVAQSFDGSRFFLGIITLILCFSVVWFIQMARRGKPLKVRKIAGLEAVDEAVGRATEMGRSILFVPGIQDMNEIQTIAGLTVLSRVARTAANYDATLEVPTSRSLVMSAARETVQASYLSAGRPDAFNQDLIYYVTDEQFGYVAHLSGRMVREKPAACFYMGAFFAESLILAETGNSIGAIQVAGTAMPAQLPFFVAACDYTLIGEEFFAASAYLSGEPEQLGSLKGQDVGKVIVGVVMIIGITVATIGAITGSEAMMNMLQFIKSTVLG